MYADRALGLDVLVNPDGILGVSMLRGEICSVVDEEKDTGQLSPHFEDLPSLNLRQRGQ